MTAREFIKLVPSDETGFREYANCADGYKISIQTEDRVLRDKNNIYKNTPALMRYSEYDDKIKEYISAEIATADNPPFLKNYQSGDTLDGWHVFAYVPIDIIDEIVREHGGIVL